MLSVLIPVYNWNITALVKEIHQQCVELGIAFEIITLDDFSPDLNLRKINSELILPNYRFVQSDKNLGNAEARNKLSGLSNFDCLLFLDCDVIPVRNDFVKKYLEFEGEQKVICGGILYEDLRDDRYSLRWKYGKKHEEISAVEAQKNPYLNIRGCSFFAQEFVLNASVYQFVYILRLCGYFFCLESSESKCGGSSHR